MSNEPQGAARQADGAPHSGADAGSNSGAGASQPGSLQESLRERSRVIQETREAGLRAEGGGSSDEQDIDRAAHGDLA